MTATTTLPGLGRIHQIAMPIHDIDRAVAFYRDTLGPAIPVRRAAQPGVLRLRRGPADAVAAVARARSSGLGALLRGGRHPGGAPHAGGRGVAFTEAPKKIATLPDREVWLAPFTDTEGNRWR